MAEPATKRAKVDGASAIDPHNYCLAISSIVGNVPSVVENARASQNIIIDNTNVEVEIRVGMLVSRDKRLHSRDQARKGHLVDPNRKGEFEVEFKAGIDESLARKLKEKFPKLGMVVTPATTTTVYCTGDGGRFVQDAHGMFVPTDNKRRLAVFDVGLSSHEYDLRISIANEVKPSAHSSTTAGLRGPGGAPPLVTGIPSVNWEIQRRKRRTTYTHKRHVHWKIDVTEVSSQRRVDNTLQASEPEIELELELQPEIQTAWLQETDPTKRNSLGQQICQQLMSLIDMCLSSESDTDTQEVLIPVGRPCTSYSHYSREDIERSICVVNGLLDENLQRKFEHALANKRKVGVDFVGSMPVNLFRKNLSVVLEKDYYLTEKTDGTRFLLYTLPAPSSSSSSSSSTHSTGTSCAVLLDRSRAVYTFEGNPLLAQALGEHTVLDGELVFNLTSKRPVFMVFDILLYRGQSVVARPFRDRLSLLMHAVYPAYQTALSSSREGMESPALPLMLKRFVKKTDLSVLFDQITEFHGERVFLDSEGRHHFADGIIFQPDSPYIFSKHYDLLKWKWPDLRTVDLIVMDQSSNGSLQFMCSGPNEGLVDCSKRGERNVGVGVFDSYRLRKEMVDLKQQRIEQRLIGKHVIAEVTYDVAIGMWVYKKIRKDKTEPNYIDSVLGVFMEQAEAISREELEYTLMAAKLGVENDFDAQLAKMKNTLLDWQRKKARK